MFDPQTSVPGNRNNARLENLRPDTPYSITVEPIYPEGPGAGLSGNGRTRKTRTHTHTLICQKSFPSLTLPRRVSPVHSRPVESQEPPSVRRVVHPLPSGLGPGVGSGGGVQIIIFSCR